MKNRFSAKLSLVEDGQPLQRNVAPEAFRAVVVSGPLSINQLPVTIVRDALCRGLKVLPDSQNWSGSNISSEIYLLIEQAEWYQVYDAAEALADELLKLHLQEELEGYQEEINRTLLERKVGWRMVDGRFEVRGDEAVQAVQDLALTQIAASGLAVATSEMKEAISDQSKRPEPDLSGAVHHALAALESVARHSTGDSKSTLGELLKKYPSLLKEPLKTAAEKMWGYASNEARHGSEGRALSLPDTELVVGMSIVLCSFLIKHLPVE